MLAISVALLSTEALLISMGFFMLSSLPLLVLKHDTPLDARFIRGLFNVYYLAVMFAGTATALSYAWAGKPAFALGAACVATLALALRRWIVIPRMDFLRSTMQATGHAAIAQFRLLHITGMLLNVAQLGWVAWALTRLAL